MSPATSPYPLSSVSEQTAELRAWRATGARSLEIVEQVLRAQGDGAERDLVKLQHELADLVAPGTSFPSV